MGLNKHFYDATIMTLLVRLHCRGLKDCIVGLNKCFYDATIYNIMTYDISIALIED